MISLKKNREVEWFDIYVKNNLPVWDSMWVVKCNFLLVQCVSITQFPEQFFYLDRRLGNVEYYITVFLEYNLWNPNLSFLIQQELGQVHRTEYSKGGWFCGEGPLFIGNPFIHWKIKQLSTFTLKSVSQFKTVTIFLTASKCKFLKF